MDEMRQGPDFGVPVTRNGCYDFPAIIQNTVDAEFISKRLKRYPDGGYNAALFKRIWVHFFTDDYRFERLWAKPWDGLRMVQRFGGVCSPDFSLFPEWPRVVNMWQVYRSRWLGRFWQEHGVQVIPTVSWSDSLSHHYCFDGLPDNAVYAITAPARMDLAEFQRYQGGFKAMIDRLAPKTILVYGKQHPMFDNFPVAYVDPERPYNRIAQRKHRRQTTHSTPS